MTSPQAATTTSSTRSDTPEQRAAADQQQRQRDHDGHRQRHRRADRGDPPQPLVRRPGRTAPPAWRAPPRRPPRCWPRRAPGRPPWSPRTAAAGSPRCTSPRRRPPWRPRRRRAAPAAARNPGGSAPASSSSAAATEKIPIRYAAAYPLSADARLAHVPGQARTGTGDHRDRHRAAPAGQADGGERGGDPAGRCPQPRPCGVVQPDRSGPSGTIRVGLIMSWVA